ncbi:MAG: indolepyruvate oxidoreductase subunit beta [Desulfamplus sp.]|nr:indolepyruvate oxidoreductase subunit beta [Desulfamplus sp.]
METKRLIIVAVGGQGNLLASRVLGEAALLSGIEFRMSEIHGMAQRGGVVESSILFGDAKSTIISDGEADLLVGFEPSETLRAMGRCHKETQVVTSLSPVPPFTVAIGRGTYPEIDVMQKLIEERTSRLIAFDAMTLAREAGSPMTLNIVMVGALIQSNILDLTRESVAEAIQLRTKPAFTDMNLKAFDLGFDASRACCALYE